VSKRCSASVAHAMARAVSFARGSAHSYCSVNVVLGQSGSGHRRICLAHSSHTGRPKHGMSWSRACRRPCPTATTPQSEQPPMVSPVSMRRTRPVPLVVTGQTRMPSSGTCGSRRPTGPRPPTCSATRSWPPAPIRRPSTRTRPPEKEDRPELAACLKALRHGDTLVVWKLDRLGRDLRHLVNIVHDLTERGIGLKVLTGQGAAIDTTTASGKLVFGIFAGLASARARGRHGGRPYKMTPAKLRLALASMGKPDTKVSDLCTELGITRQTLYRHVSPTGNCAPTAKSSCPGRRPRASPRLNARFDVPVPPKNRDGHAAPHMR
jgi:hypothetical protein